MLIRDATDAALVCLAALGVIFVFAHLLGVGISGKPVLWRPVQLILLVSLCLLLWIRCA